VVAGVEAARLTPSASAGICGREFVAKTRGLDAREIREARQLIHDSGVLDAA
jgi:hypothetical protein